MKKTYLLICVAAILALTGCSTDEIEHWNVEADAFAQFSSDAYIVYSFAGQPAEVNSTVITIPVTIVAGVSTHQRSINIAVAEKPSNPATRIDYPTHITVEPGQTEASLDIIVYRTPNLTVANDCIVFSIADSESFRSGLPERRLQKVIVSDRFEVPSWWGSEYDEYYNPIGAPNELKLALWFEVFGNFDDPTEGRRGWTGNTAVIALYKADQAALAKYGKRFHEIQPGDTPKS